MIRIIFKEYDLLGKILTIGFDNASANTVSIKDLIEIYQPNLGGRFFHVRCTCHVLNLCVQNGLNELQCYIDPIKKTLNCIWFHSHVKSELAKFCKENDVKPIKFSCDVPTRWNSTYFLLTQSFTYKNLLCCFFPNIVNILHFIQSNGKFVKEF